MKTANSLTLGLVVLCSSCSAADAGGVIFAHGQYHHVLTDEATGEVSEDATLNTAMEIHPLADSPGAHLLVADAGLFSGCRAIFLPSSDPADLPSIQDPSQCATFRSEDADPATENRTLLRLESGTIEVGALGVIASMTGVFERQVGSDVANTETALCSITIDGDRFD